ncbi:MAG: PP2C family protein-serine/threonine phosphatase [Anaerolineae bacterium]|nr:PP2C family protein-serine/threonine phosphatase [Anaerolineae bacterium]
MLLIEPLESFNHQLEALARAWLAEGAKSFSLWKNDTLLATWPTNNTPTKNDLSARLLINGQMHGQIQLSGIKSSQAHARLQAEAKLLSQLLELEVELDNLTAELIDAQDQLVALYEVTHSARSHLDLNDALWALIQEVKRLTKAKGAFVILNVRNRPPIVEQTPSSLTPLDTLEYLLQEMTEVNSEMLLHTEDVPGGLPLNTNSLFITPLPITEKASAILGVFFNQSTSSLSPHLKLARAIAEYAGSQIENALLHEELIDQTRIRTELEVAARIQVQLLPSDPPHVPQLDIAAGSRPALQVGGDFYDFIYQPDTPFTFILGDVSGKGMSAALLMAISRTVLRSKSKFSPAPGPDTILAFANEEMYDDFTEVGMFATVFVGQYNVQQSKLIFANAGHSPVIYYQAGGEARLLEADGPAMGILPTSLSKSCELPFNTGDVLVIATDGFSEARNSKGEMFGYNRLCMLLEIIAQKSAKEISDCLFENINTFGFDCPQDDDQTLIVIKGK